MKIKELLITLFLLGTCMHVFPQQTFEGTVVKQSYIKLMYKSTAKTDESIRVNIKRLELNKYEILYAWVKEFVQTLDTSLANPKFKHEATINKSGILQFEDHAVVQGRAYVYWLQSPNGNIIAGPLALKVRDPKVWWSQEFVEQTTDRLSFEYPELARKQNLGKTVEGNPINGLLVGNKDNAVLLIGYTHAGESGAELQLYTAEQLLLKNKDLMSKVGVIIIPVLNIDSRNRLINGVPEYQRKNSNGVDLNRNYPTSRTAPENLKSDPTFNQYPGLSPASEPETQTVIRTIDKYKPKLVLDYHWMGTITGCNLLTIPVQNTIVNSKLNQFANCFQKAFEYLSEDIKKIIPVITANSAAINIGTTSGYCMTIKNIPSLTIEGNNSLDPIMDRASSDMATKEDLKIYQEIHYRAIFNILEYLSQNPQ